MNYIFKRVQILTEDNFVEKHLVGRSVGVLNGILRQVFEAFFIDARSAAGTASRRSDVTERVFNELILETDVTASVCGVS